MRIVVMVAGMRSMGLLAVVLHRHAEARARGREALQGQRQGEQHDDEAKLQPMHLLKLYYRRMETVELKVEGMDCDGCVKSVTRMLSGVAGVQKVDVSLAEGRATVTYDPAKSQVADMKRAVERAGYKAP
jgi:copper chaperone